MKDLNIPIIGSSTGGKNGRKIIFNTYSGEVRQRYVQRQEKKQ
jgi:chemotaxis protein CheD